MNPTLPTIKDRIAEKVGKYFDEFTEVIRKHQEEGRDVKFSFAATITDSGVEYRASVGVKGVQAPKTEDKFDDPNQPELGGVS